MKKKFFYLTLLLCFASFGQQTAVYGSDQPSEADHNMSSFSSSFKDYRFLSFEKERLRNFYNSNFPKKDYKSIILGFKDSLQSIIAESEGVRLQIQQAKNMEGKIKTLEKKIEENKIHEEKQQKILSKYYGSSKKDILHQLNQRKSHYEQRISSLSKEEEADKEALEIYLRQVKEEWHVLNIPELQIQDENSVNQSLILQCSTIITNNPAEKLKDLNKTYDQLIELKIKTVYNLPEPFKNGNLISPPQLLERLNGLGVEKETQNLIYPDKFARFCVRCLELPNPKMEIEDNIAQNYLSHIDDLIRLYNLRLREDLFNFHYFSAIGDIIGEQSPYEKEEKAIILKFMSPTDEQDSSQGREAFAKIFKDQGYNPEERNLTNLIKKAIPHHSLGLIQVISSGLNNYQGFSFILDNDVPLPVKAAEKILKGDNNINEEFYACRNKVVRDKFNLDVLQVIRDNFTKYASPTPSLQTCESEEDTIF